VTDVYIDNNLAQTKVGRSRSRLARSTAGCSKPLVREIVKHIGRLGLVSFHPVVSVLIYVTSVGLARGTLLAPGGIAASPQFSLETGDRPSRPRGVAAGVRFSASTIECRASFAA